MGMKRKSLLEKIFGSAGSCGCCCGSNIVSVREIEITGKNVDVLGLDDEFEKRCSAGVEPDELDDDVLIQALSEINEIPESEKDAYKEAFLREYRLYWKENVE